MSIPFASFFEGFYPTAFSAALLIVVLAPFIEEIAKVFPLFYRHGETERSIVTLGLLIGLGFGIAEFIEYVFFVGVPPIARVPGIIFHASSATITAYGIAKKNPLPYYLLAVTLHIANNFLALSGDIFFGVFADSAGFNHRLPVSLALLSSGFKGKNGGLTNPVGSELSL